MDRAYIIEYEPSGYAGLQELQKRINSRLACGWNLVGSPFTSDRFIYQAMIIETPYAKDTDA